MDATQPEAVEREVLARARSRVRAQLGFRWHLAAFVVVNVGLFAICSVYTPNSSWYAWPAVCWGLALVMHGAVAFYTFDMVDSMLEQELQKERAKRGLPTNT